MTATLDQQTIKQPVWWVCANPECRESVVSIKPFTFQSDYAECPKCGCKAPHVVKRALIHFVQPDKNGKIIGQFWKQYRLACDQGRDFIATEHNGEAGTNEPTLVNCAGCLLEMAKGN